jgi:hypothetical protein
VLDTSIYLFIFALLSRLKLREIYIICIITSINVIWIENYSLPIVNKI